MTPVLISVIKYKTSAMQLMEGGKTVSKDKKMLETVGGHFIIHFFFLMNHKTNFFITKYQFVSH